MPDVSRSDSQRSDTSQTKPRVSFNRDVHVKRIVVRPGEKVEKTPKENEREYVKLTPITKKSSRRSNDELKKEAIKVLEESKKAQCIISSKRGIPNEKYYTLPNLRQKKALSQSFSRNFSQENKVPRKTATFSRLNKKPSVFEIFDNENEKKSNNVNLRRSVSDVTDFKTKNPNKTHQNGKHFLDLKPVKPNLTRKQLSPIIEIHQREDYFPEVFTYNDRNHEGNSVNESVKNNIDPCSRNVNISHDTSRNHVQTERTEPEIIIIDLDKAEQISHKKNSKTNILGKRFKTLANLKKTGFPDKSEEYRSVQRSNTADSSKSKNKVPNTFENIGRKMIHSSQQPVERLPLTKGKTVNNIVKRLSNDSASSLPPRTNILVTPNNFVKHNDNQPFSYTRGLSPDKTNLNDHENPVIYAQVICAKSNTGPSKQTIHTVYNANSKKYLQHSDSDEGLGNEDHSNKKFNIIYPKRTHSGTFDHIPDNDGYFVDVEPSHGLKEQTYFNEYSFNEMFTDAQRGRADGMDAKRRESSTESIENDKRENNSNVKMNWSERRDMLESRIFNRKIDNAKMSTLYTSDNNTETRERYHSNRPLNVSDDISNESDFSGHKFSERPINGLQKGDYHEDRKDYVEYVTNSKYCYEPQQSNSHSIGYELSSEARFLKTSPKTKKFYSPSKTHQSKLTKNRKIHKSNPEMASILNDANRDESYHDSLRRERKIYKSDMYMTRKKDGENEYDVGNDSNRDSDNFRSTYRKSNRTKCVDSEDEGFASSLLISNEKHIIDDNFESERDEDCGYDAPYVSQEMNYTTYRTPIVSRERSEADGCHLDSRTNNYHTDEESSKKKPPKITKMSSLAKVKQLFMGTSKKKKEMQAKDEDLHSRYREYRGSGYATRKEQAQDYSLNENFKNRSRLPTPSPETQRSGNVSDSNTSHNSWFKSLDRLSRKKVRKNGDNYNTTNAEKQKNMEFPPSRNLRFFGDSLREKFNSRSQIDLRGSVTKELRDNDRVYERRGYETSKILRRNKHNPSLNTSDSEREISKSSMKPPNHRMNNSLRHTKYNKNEMSSLESSNEGDSSQQTLRNIVYLHAATVGDIPGPGYLRNGSRAVSREELALNSYKMNPHMKKTLSRSFSVLAPWKPKNNRESIDIDYSQQSAPISKAGKYEQRIPKNNTNKLSTSSTLKKKVHETRKSNQNISSTHYRNKSKENLNEVPNSKVEKKDSSKASTSTLYRKKSRSPWENARYSRERDDGLASSKSISVESLGRIDRRNRKNRDNNTDISRSISIPRDAGKSAGWFESKKNCDRITTQRL